MIHAIGTLHEQIRSREIFQRREENQGGAAIHVTQLDGQGAPQSVIGRTAVVTDVDAPATDASVAPDTAPAPESLHDAPVTRLFGQRVAHPSTRGQLADLVATLARRRLAPCAST